MGNCCASPGSETGSKKGKPKIKSNPFYSEAYTTNGSGTGFKLSVLKDPTGHDISLMYDLGREVGRGEFGITYLCTDIKTGEKYACKSISKKKLRTAVDIEDVRREVEIMKHMPRHPNIVSLKDAFEDDDAVHIVMELCVLDFPPDRMNREEALRSLHIAQKHFDSDNYPSAIRFAKKSISLFDTPQAQTLLGKAEELSTSGTKASASSSGVDPSASSEGVRQRKSEQTSTAQPTNSNANGNAKASTSSSSSSANWTAAQAAVVKRVKACKVTSYYEILSLEKSCSDADIKKAYRKLALGLHPDKNLAPGAEEAFKMVSKAFQVLSDGNKRAIFDQTGSDPDSRGGGGGGGGGMGNFARRGPGGGGFGGGGFGQAEEMSPEDLFRFFFNGGGGGGFGGPMGGGGGFGGMGGPFGGGGGFQFYGPGGIRMQTGGGRPRGGGAQANQQPQTTASTLLQLAPLLLFLLISVITQLPGMLFGSSSTPLPEFSFDRTSRFPLQQETHSLHVPYFVNPTQFASHPLYDSYVRSNPSLGFQSSNPTDSKLYKRDLVDFLLEQEKELQKSKEENQKRPKEELSNEYHKFEKSVENSWINRLQSYCRHEINNRQDALDRARGFLGIGADYDKIRKLTAQKLPSCEALAEYGYSVRY